jgi:hypothetical protein
MKMLADQSGNAWRAPRQPVSQSRTEIRTAKDAAADRYRQDRRLDEVPAMVPWMNALFEENRQLLETAGGAFRESEQRRPSIGRNGQRRAGSVIRHSRVTAPRPCSPAARRAVR